MSARTHARPLTEVDLSSGKSRKALAPQLVPPPTKPPQVRLGFSSTEPQPRRFARVPTHAVGVHPEHREYPRATLKLPLKLRSVNQVAEDFPITLVTRDISS